ncbi:MAG: GNAT family N-acetyltransferase, partial [Candidatus Omnitrophota bacterium]
GLDFLRALYDVLSKNDAGILIVALQDQKVAGFISGAISIKPVYKSLIKNNWFLLFRVLLPKIFSKGKLRKIIDLGAYFFRSGGKREDSPSAELLSLVVDEKYQRTDIAKALFDQLGAAFLAKGIWRFKIVVGNALIPAKQFYEKIGAQKYANAEIHKGEASTVYLFDSTGRGICWTGKPDWIRRYSAFLQRAGQKSILIDGVLWTDYQRMIVPVGPVSCDYVMPLGKSRDDLFHFFKKCILIRAGSGFVVVPDAWYCIFNDTHIPIEKMISKEGRSKVRQGLQNCMVRRIDMNVMEKEAWSVYSAAFKRYRNPESMETENQFKRDIMNTVEFEDIIHHWGVFEKRTGRLIAYAQNYIYEKTEVYYWTIRFDPDFLGLYPSYALFYEMNRYYLNEEKFAYVNDGFRCLLHETNIQDFLIHKMHFKKKPIGLKIHYRPFIGKCMSATYPFRRLLGKLSQPLAALYKLEEINRNQ